MVDDERELRVALRDAEEFRPLARSKKHDGNARLLRRRPKPIGGAVREPCSLRAEERNANSQHPRLLLPFRKNITRLRARQRDPPHDGKPVGKFFRGLERVVHAIALPGGWDDDDAIDASLVHHRQQLVIGERLRQLRHHAGTPWPVRRLRLPQMHLRIDDQPAPCA